MSTIRLEFPILVRRDHGGERLYRVRPLLFDGPVGRGRRFDRALRGLLRAVRSEVTQLGDSRSELERMLWYRFQPDVQFERFDLSFTSGKRIVSGPFAAAWFDHGEHRYICLPGFDRHLFIGPPPERKGRYPMAALVQQEVEHLLRRARRESEDELIHERHESPRGEFVSSAVTTAQLRRPRFPFEEDPSARFAAFFGESETFSGAQELPKVADELNQRYPDELERRFGAEEPVLELRRRLFGADVPRVALLGPEGAGKTTLLHAAVRSYLDEHRHQAADRLQTVWHLDPSRVISGMSIVGQWQRRLEAVLEELRDRLYRRYRLRRLDLLFVDNVVALAQVGKSAQNDMTVSDLLKPYLEAQELGMVLEATPSAWTRLAELDRGFCELFEVIRVERPSPAWSNEIVIRHRAAIEQEHRCAINNPALLRVLDLVRRFDRRRELPGGAVSLMRGLGVKHTGQTVDVPQVDQSFRDGSHLRSWAYDPNEPLDERDVRARLRRRLVGQDDAVDALVETLHTIKAQLNDPERPIVSLLFIGPTGVGKTEAAKALAEAMFDDPSCFIRFDMNELVDSEATARLIGGPGIPNGQLTGRVLYRPHCLLLFDEIEKAHPSVHDLLLQLLGEGRLTDCNGQTVSFSNAIVIMTSNVGARDAKRHVGFGQTAISDAALAYRRAVEQTFRPELVNRIDRLVCFRALTRTEIQHICRIQIRRLMERHGFARRTTVLRVSERVLEQIADQGFDPEMGGRALKRAIERQLTGVAAEHMVELTHDQPMLFDVYATGGQVRPRVTALRPVEPADGVLASIPEGADLRELYGQWLERTNRLIEGVREYREQHGSGVSADELLDSLLWLRDELDDHAGASGGPAVAPHGAFARLNRSPAPRRKFGVGSRAHTLSFAQREDVRLYLQEVYEGAELHGRSRSNAALMHLLELDWMALQHRQLGSTRRIVVYLEALLDDDASGTAQSLIAHLMDVYARLANLGEVHALPGGRHLGVADVPAGPGLLDGEAGLHLLFPAQGSPQLVRVHVLPLTADADPNAMVHEHITQRQQWLTRFEHGHAGQEPEPGGCDTLVRLYCPATRGEAGTVTDLRTGLMDTYPPSDLSWSLWLKGLLGSQQQGSP